MEVAEGDCDKTFFTSPYDLLQFTRMLRSENCPRGVSQSDERPIYHRQVPICPYLLRRKCHIFAIARRPHRSRSTSINVIIRQWCHIKVEKCEFFKNFCDYFAHFICLARLKVPICTIDAIHGLEYPTTVIELPIFSRPMQRILPLRAKILSNRRYLQ